MRDQKVLEGDTVSPNRAELSQNSEVFLSAGTELSTSRWLFVCFGFLVHNFAILYTVEPKDQCIVSRPGAFLGQGEPFKN